jgi:hypothetical protein
MIDTWQMPYEYFTYAFVEFYLYFRDVIIESRVFRKAVYDQYIIADRTAVPLLIYTDPRYS